jgi:hypothetical protein
MVAVVAPAEDMQIPVNLGEGRKAE